MEEIRGSQAEASEVALEGSGCARAVSLVCPEEFTGIGRDTIIL